MSSTIAPGTAGRLIALLALVGGVLASGCGTERVSAAELERIVEVLGLESGMSVADVGAGDGKWSVLLAHHVGEEGHVWATEVEARELEEIEARIAAKGLHNITAVMGGQVETGLPDDCCDAVLLRLVYHHFEQPAAMRAGLRRALRPGGLIAIIDIVPQGSWRNLPEVPDRGGHGISVEDLVAEMVGDGFTVVSRHDRWNGDGDRYCVVFRP